MLGNTFFRRKQSVLVSGLNVIIGPDKGNCYTEVGGIS